MHKVKVNDGKEVEINWDGAIANIDGVEQTPDILKLHDGSYSIILNGHSYTCEVTNINKEEKTAEVKVNNHLHSIKLKDRFDLLLAEMGLDSMLTTKVNNVKAPMPGLVLKNLVQEGDTILKGDGLLILEAMKMENIIKSPCDGVIKKVCTVVQDAVDKNDILIEFE
jgi:biotin carboxyl carrier protein